MKVQHALLSCITFATLVNAEAFQYSPGWSPGHTMTKSTPSTIPTASFKPGTSAMEPFSWTSLLTSGPIGHLFARIGVNMTEKLAEAQQKASELPWDERIPMIRDDNFEELIFNETFVTPEEEDARVWFIVVTVTSSQRTGVSAVIDQEFNEAYKISLSERDLPNVRWGRIDYLNVTRLTTKWAVWRAPMFIVAKDRGKTLRFFHPQQFAVKAPRIHEFLVEEAWVRKQPWIGPWAPGGSREGVLDKFATFQEMLYIYMSMIPRWMLLLISGSLGSVFLNIFHRKPAPTNPLATPADKTAQPKDTPVQSTPSVRAEVKKEGTQKRKSNKK